MLGHRDAVANVAVKDLSRAQKFYADVLGLTQVGEMGGELIAFQSGNSRLNVYRSRFAGTNQATAVTWDVGDEIDATVKALEAKGVRFEHYELPNLKLEGDVHVDAAAKMKVAWFKDPDGNILNLVGR